MENIFENSMFLASNLFYLFYESGNRKCIRDETSVVTEQEETQDTEAFTSETDAQQTETEQTSEQFTSETETETSAETEEQIPDSIEVEKLEKEIQEAT